MIFSSYVVSASRLVGSKPFAQVTLDPVAGVIVSTVAVVPDLKTTSIIPDAGTAMVSVLTSPHT